MFARDSALGMVFWHMLRASSLMKLYSCVLGDHFHYCCSVWDYCSYTLSDAPKQSFRIIIDSRLYASAVSLLRSLVCQALEELISSDIQIMAFKALKGLDLQSLSELCSRNSKGFFQTLRNTSTDLNFPLIGNEKVKGAFNAEVQNTGTASQPSPTKQ